MNIVNYFRETKAELRHVSWPTRRQAVIYTAIVIGVSLAVAVLLGIFDAVFNFLLRLVLT